MPKLIVIMRDESETVIDAKAGLSVMENIRSTGTDDLLALCGGCCSCATCHVFVDAAFVDRMPPLSVTENELLDILSNRKETSRLSCQLPFVDSLDGLKVEIAPDE